MYRVLLIDDERLALVSTEHSLDWRACGFHDVRSCQNPYEAMDLLRGSRFDAAFVDIRMPEVSGLELMQRLSDLSTSYVVLTGYSDFSYARQALQLHVFDYCLKPLQPEDTASLLPRLRDHLWDTRLREDPALYKGLLCEGDPESRLRYLGLDPDQPFLLAAAVCAEDPADLSMDLSLPGRQATLLLSSRCAVKLLTCGEARLATAREALLSRAGTFGAAVCLMENKRLSTLKSILPHAVTLADIALQRHLQEGRPKVTAFDAMESQSWNADFLQLLSEVSASFTEDLSLADLAERYHLNYSYCSTLFRQRTGMPFSKYINALRLQRAKDLLETTDLPIGEISYGVGYNNYNHFVAMFKKSYKVTPTEYRQSFEKGVL